MLNEWLKFVNGSTFANKILICLLIVYLNYIHKRSNQCQLKEGYKASTPDRNYNLQMVKK
jgi:hypothetical protein